MHDVHVWTLCTGTYYGSLRVDVMAGADTRRTLAAARNILTQVTMRDQRERERGGRVVCIAVTIARESLSR